MKKLIQFTLWTLLISSCSTSSKKEVSPGHPSGRTDGMNSTSTPSSSTGAMGAPEIDYQSIKRLLRLDRDRTKLGLAEKAFNTCQVGFGYPSDQNCRIQYLISIHFQMRCRESEGTVSNIVRNEDLTPVAGETLSWYLKGLQGQTQTDSEGYAEVLAVSSEQQTNQRFRLSNQKDFLLMKTQDVNHVMVPKNWCR